MTNRKFTQFSTFNAALLVAYSRVPCCVGWHQALPTESQSYWFIYDPAEGCPAGSDPEFFIHTRGHMPLALSPYAHEVLYSMLKSKLEDVAR